MITITFDGAEEEIIRQQAADYGCTVQELIRTAVSQHPHIDRDRFRSELFRRQLQDLRAQLGGRGTLSAEEVSFVLDGLRSRHEQDPDRWWSLLQTREETTAAPPEPRVIYRMVLARAGYTFRPGELEKAFGSATR